jgi:hypothetical protein
MKGENSAEIAEHKRQILEDQVIGLKKDVNILTSKLAAATTALQSAEQLSERLQRADTSQKEKLSELESRLELESGQKQSLQMSLRELELRHKIELQDLNETLEVAKRQNEINLSKLKSEFEWLQAQERTSSETTKPKQSNSSKGGSSSSSNNSNTVSEDQGLASTLASSVKVPMPAAYLPSMSFNIVINFS